MEKSVFNGLVKAKIGWLELTRRYKNFEENREFMTRECDRKGREQASSTLESQGES